MLDLHRHHAIREVPTVGHHRPEGPAVRHLGPGRHRAGRVARLPGRRAASYVAVTVALAVVGVAMLAPQTATTYPAAPLPESVTVLDVAPRGGPSVAVVLAADPGTDDTSTTTTPPPPPVTTTTSTPPPPPPEGDDEDEGEGDEPEVVTTTTTAPPVEQDNDELPSCTE